MFRSRAALGLTSALRQTTRTSAFASSRLFLAPTASAPRFHLTTTNSFHTTSKMASPISAQVLLDLIKQRRTYYPLSKDLGSLSKERITEIVKEATLHVPSSFNAQPTRAVVLFGADHERLWDITAEALKPVVPAEGWAATEGKINMFKASAGSVLFFDDEPTVKKQQEAFPLYAHNFPIWASQSNGMLQHVIWVALEAEGLGANLQHYNPLIDAKVAEQWKLPAEWKLSAQLVFGGKTGDAGDKTFIPVEERVKVFGQ